VKTYRIAAPFVLALSLSCLAQSAPEPAGAAANAAPGAVVPMTAEDAVAEALEANPQIHAPCGASRWRDRKSQPRAVSTTRCSWCATGYSLEQPWDLNQAQLMVSIQQTFVNKQKRDLRAKVAGDDAEMAASDLESLRQEIAAQVRKICADLRRNAEEMKLHDRESSLLKEALAAALAQYSTGRVPQVDVLRAQMAVTRLDEHLIELNQERDTAQAELNVLMGRPATSRWRFRRLRCNGGDATARRVGAVGDEHRPELTGLRQGLRSLRTDRS